MPLFEYRCSACQSEFELLIRGAVVPTCPSCGSTTLEKLLSLFGVSSAETTMRHRKSLGVSDRAKSASVQKEREHFRSDHHDD